MHTTVCPLTVVFDLDGTLVDTAPDLVGTLNALLAGQGLQPIAITEARPMIGGGARKLIERGLRNHGLDWPRPMIDQLYADYLAHYADHLADCSRPFPGLQVALETLAERGHRLAVCTNKLEWLSRRLLDALGLTPHFVAICGQDTFGIQKPDPQILLRTIDQAGGTPARAIMVGDSINDIEAARGAHVPVIGVDFGYSDIPIAALCPDRIISDFRDLNAVIDDLSGQFQCG